MPRTTLLVLLSLLLATPALAGDKRFSKDLASATRILDEVGEDVPTWLRTDARCVSVMRIKKGGFVFGGVGGTGWVTCRDEGGTDWSAPLILDIAGGSAGAQIGGQAIELVMIHRDVRDAGAVAHASPVFQGAVSATAGEEGVGASAGGDPSAEAGIITFSRSSGLYAGAVGESFVVKPAAKLNAELYGAEVDLEAVLIRREVKAPPVAATFLKAVAEFVSTPKR